MAHHSARIHSPYAVQAAQLLGAQIRLARRERRWSQQELAERAGITVRTIYKIEHGEMGVRLGSAFEVAALVGVALFYTEPSRLAAELDRVRARSALLPRPTRTPRDAWDDF